MKTYIKVFLIMGVPYGVIMGTMTGVKTGLMSGIATGLVQGLFFGGIISLVLGSLHNSQTKGMEPDQDGEVGPHQVRDESIEGSFEEVFDKCLLSLAKIGASIKAENKESGSIEAKMSISWKSFGENLIVSLERLESEKVRVKISSSPVLKTTKLDYGKSRENVTAFMKELNS